MRRRLRLCYSQCNAVGINRARSQIQTKGVLDRLRSYHALSIPKMFLFTAYSVTHSHERNIVAANASCIVVICDVLFSHGKSVEFSVSRCSFVISDANVALGRVIFKNVAAHIFRAAMARNEKRWKPLNLETQTIANAAEVHQANWYFPVFAVCRWPMLG